ncbi:MAG TPA: hypothetical protein VKY82_05115, partial [Flavobacterium sp.]|nr:hypothetical protein [Flavobacterium sp.]
YQPHNLGEQTMRGVHLRWNHQLEIATNQRFSYQLSYQYLSPKKEDSNDAVISKYVVESLKHQAILGLHYSYEQFGVQWQNRYVKRELNDGYFISDLRLMYDFAQFQLYTQATNLFNEAYREAAAVPMPGRWIQLGVKYKLDFKK